MNEKPILGITMGDVCGAGPEITVKCLMDESVYDCCRPIIVGDARMVKRAMDVVHAERFALHPVHAVSDALFQYGTIDVYDARLEPCEENPPYATVCEIGGRSAYMAVAEVIRLAMAGEVDATVTGPLNKEAMNLAGFHYSGHTEIYADHTGSKEYAMMLADGKLRVVHVSTHVSLRRACDLVKKDRVLQVIKLGYDACRDLGIESPRVAVAGLNPHAGEHGMFGSEEYEEIIPAIEMARAAGIDVEGPVPPDTVFSKARGGMYDIVVVMYHDQGHIPLKVVGFTYDESRKAWDSVTGVNITLGLPIIRASVDHGTVFGKAGKGTASHLSMLNAIAYGAKLAEARRAAGEGRNV